MAPLARDAELLQKLKQMEENAWLLFSDTKLARRLEADGSGLSARQQPRFACEFLAEVNYLGAKFPCRIEDLSA